MAEGVRVMGSDEDVARPPVGWDLAVCVDVSKGTAQPVGGGDWHYVEFVFQLRMRRPNGFRVHVTARMTESLSQNSRLRRMLRTWLCRDFTPEELKVGVVLDGLVINRPARIYIDYRPPSPFPRVTEVLPPTGGDKDAIFAPEYYGPRRKRFSQPPKGKDHGTDTRYDAAAFRARRLADARAHAQDPAGSDVLGAGGHADGANGSAVGGGDGDRPVEPPAAAEGDAGAGDD